MVNRLGPIALASFFVVAAAVPAVAQDKCDAPELVVDAAIYGGPTRGIEASLSELQLGFGEAFRSVCETIGTTPDLLGSGQLATEIQLLNAPEANILSIYDSDERQALVAEYPFEVDGILSTTMPDTSEFRRAIICALGRAQEFELDETACLPD